MALTFTPANNTTLVEPLGMQKSAISEEDERLIKSMIPLAQINIPSFIDISSRLSHERLSSKVDQITKAVKDIFNPAPGASHEAVLQHHIDKVKVDATHLKTISGSMHAKGVHPSDIARVITHIKDKAIGKVTHIDKGEDDIEKGHIRDLVRNLVVAGALSYGAHEMGPEDEDSKVQVDSSKASYMTEQKKRLDAFNAKHPSYKPNIKKALTAGYGGAGAPTNLTGAGVLQPESLEGKAKKSDEFKYITCDKCLKEQIHHDKQVKCRDCGKGFALDNLYRVMKR